MSGFTTTESEDFDLMWSLHVERDIRRNHKKADALVFPCWLAMWRRIARDHLMGFIWWA